MSAIINLRRQVSVPPYAISSLDVDVATYINGLASNDIFSDTASLEWGFAVSSLEGEDAAGTAYIVSAAAMRKIISGRFAG